MLNDIMLIVIVPNVIRPNVVAPFYKTDVSSEFHTSPTFKETTS
jgi:hypothetical protein